jgi:hypothetical protein
MSRIFHGYVEIMSNGQWELVFTTDAFFAGGNNGPMARLFGSPGESLVGERGIPTDASPSIREYYEHFADDEYMRDEIVHPSWLLHSEWVASADEVMGFHKGWRTLYLMMQALAEFFGPEHVRFIAWQMI